MPEPQPVVSIRKVFKIYHPGPHAVYALNGVSFDVHANDYVAVVGRSGSGKSTLMNILGLMDQPTEGQYCLDGDDVSGASRSMRAEIRNRCIGFVFQSFHLLPNLTARENCELPLQYDADVGRAERRAWAEQALVKVGLADKLDARPTELSGGQQQRVAIARALVNQPRMLLADEPTGNLDTRTSWEILALLETLHDQGLTVVAVTHDAEIRRCASRVVELKDGRVRRIVRNLRPTRANDVLRQIKAGEQTAAARNVR